jgi:hypothetical protein
MASSRGGTMGGWLVFFREKGRGERTHFSAGNYKILTFWAILGILRLRRCRNVQRWLKTGLGVVLSCFQLLTILVNFVNFFFIIIIFYFIIYFSKV